MMRTPRVMTTLLLSAAVVAALATSARAADFTIPAIQDTTIVENPTAERTVAHNEEGLKVWRNFNNTTARSAALVQFDLSSVTGVITSARLEYYDSGSGGWQGNAFNSGTYMVYPRPAATPEQLLYTNDYGTAFDEDGIHQEAVTFTSYGTASRASSPQGFWIEEAFPSMNIALPANNAADQYYAGGAADTAALSRLNTEKDVNGFAILLSWYGSLNSGSEDARNNYRTFGDIESGFAPRLILTTSTIGDFNDNGSIGLDDYNVLLANMQGHLDAGLTPMLHGNGDLNFDGKVNLDDFGLFKSLYPGGPGALAADLAAVNIPEPSTLILIGMAGFLALARRRSR